ncbi:hypothetical protein GGS24DRAFT_109820 [Hypoxylon argillaceum]|nr:hypothetical protein GGS24DRAFT_109820 [Hypoxylon argillaceum]
MKKGYAVANKLRVSCSIHSRATRAIPHTPSRPPSLRRPGSFARTPVPRTSLFDEPAVAWVLKASTHQRVRNARFLLFSRPAPPPPTTNSTTASFSRKMLNYVQVATAPTADTPGTTLIMHFDDQRYMFGHVAEGTQRALVQRKQALNRLGNIFLSGPVSWSNAGGLLGMILTVADIHVTSRENMAVNNAAKQQKREEQERREKQKKPQKKKRQETQQKQFDRAVATSLPSLDIHAGKNISHLLATSRRFIFRRGLPIQPREIRLDPRTTNPVAAPEPDWKDSNIKVWYMPLQSDRKDLAMASSRKRSHDEFRDGTVAASPTSAEDMSSEDLTEMVVTNMFNSDWTINALIETTLHQVQLPAKLFVRDEEGHLRAYQGPMLGDGGEVPDIPVLVRQPWPGATVPTLPRTEPSKQSMCYIVKGHDRRGTFNPQAAERLGVAKPDYRLLTNLQSVKGKDGNVVTPDMVLGETVAGTGFVVIDLPDTSYINALLNRPEWVDGQLIKGIRSIFWLLGPGVVNDIRIEEFMGRMHSMKHIVTSADTCPNMIALESVATQSYKLRCIDSDRFPLPAHSNKEASPLEIRGAPSSTYEIGRTGKTIQFAPHYIHQDDKIVPFPDIQKLAQRDFDKSILEIAAEARSKISDPDFIAKVEKAEADIPNRDAEIVSLGTGSALPSKYRNVSATLVRVPGYGNYLFDAGENTMGQLRRVFGDELPSVLQDLKVIWISHLHADHHLGTVSVIKSWHEETMKSNPSAQLMVVSHGHMIEWLREYSDVENFGFERLVTVGINKRGANESISEPRVFSSAETEQFGLEKIEGCWVNHCMGALATVFTFPSGLKVAYSGDCRPSKDFVKIGQGATLLIHESTFDDELRKDAIIKKHSTMSEAIDVGRRMGARRILLTHFSQRYQNVPNLEEDFEIPAEFKSKDKAREDEVILVAFDYMRVKLGDFRKAQAFLPAIQKLFSEETE